MFDLNVRFIKNYVINDFPFASFVVTSSTNQYIANIDYNYFSNECHLIKSVNEDTIKEIFNITYMDEYYSLGDAITAEIKAKVKEKIV
ncbi:MAG: hypothetical protein HFJ42_01350 [Clostridia bacterium]|nr:hypothetical protein [Clostridia bacterium]